METKKEVETKEVVTKKEASKVKHVVYSSGSSETSLSTEKLAGNLTICKEWIISIDLKLPNRSTTERRNIFSVHDNNNTAHAEQRILEASMRLHQSNFMLMIAYNIDTSQRYKFNITKKVNIGNWINIKISQINKVYETRLDYNLVYNRTNFVPKEWTSVNVLVGKAANAKENISTIVNYRNFKLKTCKTKGTNRKQQSLTSKTV